MIKWLIRSVVAMVLLLTVTGTALADEKGVGFYMDIYEDTVKNPNRLAEEAIKDRFGIDFKVNLIPPPEMGQYTFARFFRSSSEIPAPSSAPILKSSLKSDCVRMKAAEADDEIRLQNLLLRRFREREEAANASKASADELNREYLLRVIKRMEGEAKAALEEDFKALSDYTADNENRSLFKCYKDLSAEVDYELKLQGILNPSRKRLEAMQTFMNGTLDDGESFPQYDLLFDIDVVDTVIFGSEIHIPGSRGSGSQTDDGNGNDRSPAPGQNQNPPAQPGDIPENPDVDEQILALRDDPITDFSDKSTTLPASSTQPATSVVSLPDPTGTEFGTSSTEPAGPFCVVTPQGLNLDYSGLGESKQLPGIASLGSSGAEGSSTVAPALRTEESVPSPAVDVVSSDLDKLRKGDSVQKEGVYNISSNRKAICEGDIGVDFGNDILKLIFCLDISFEKLGKSWELAQKSSRNDDCLFCHVSAINQIFEEKVLNTSVRAHKNTGTIMESAICEGGYGNDVGFNFSLELVPVKFYDDICYPEGGVTDSTYAELIGYPEIVSRVDKPDSSVNCFDFVDKKAIERCKEALGGKDSLTYEEFRKSYLHTLQWKTENVGDINKKTHVWARLVGDRGIAARELHFFLYRMGEGEALFEEDTVVERDIKQRMDELRATGGSWGNIRDLEMEIAKERERVDKITSQWNKRDTAFNTDHQCGVGSGIYDAFVDQFKNDFTRSFYYGTDERKIQSTAEQVTGQISANTEIDDIGELLSAIDDQVQYVTKADEEEALQQKIKTQQEKSLYLVRELSPELENFSTALQAFTAWWLKMVDKPDFRSQKAQGMVPVMESFLEKVQ